MREVLSKRDIPYHYNELRTADEYDAFVAKTHMLGLPVLVIDGNPILCKNIKRVESILRKLNA